MIDTKYTEEKADIVYETNLPFSIDLMDVEFNRTSKVTNIIKEYCLQNGYDIDSISIITSFKSNLKRKDGNLLTKTNLVITKKNDLLTAYYFAECSIL